MRDIMLILHLLGLTMGMGTSFAHAFLGGTIAKMEKVEATKFRLRVMALSRMGYIGITLLVISGLYLMSPFWSTLGSYPLLITKLILVLILTILIILIGIGAKKASRGNAEENLKKIEPLGKLTLVIGLAIVILAVKVFH